jgi:hypothetical protein
MGRNKKTTTKIGVKMYNNLNQKLSDMRSGNYLVKVTSIGDKRPNKYYSREYFVTVKYQVTDMKR